jgi:hypothetical protein
MFTSSFPGHSSIREIGAVEVGIVPVELNVFDLS